MAEQIIVLGAGYAGAGAITSIESTVGDDVEVTWVSETDYHLVLHESHRCIRDPSVKEKVTIPVREIKEPETTFIRSTVTSVDTDARVVELANEQTLDYDYLLVALGSQSAFFGIDGLEEHALTLKCLDDALAIHDEVTAATNDANPDDPASVVIGGAGLSGIQTAGELAELRDAIGAPMEITVVEGLDSVLPNSDPELQGAIQRRLEEHDIEIRTGEFIDEVDEDTVQVGDSTELDYDVLIWTGGITGRDAAKRIDIPRDERSQRINATQTFQTDDDRVFAIGDCALIEQSGDQQAPPTAQAAWQAAEVAGENVARAIDNEPLKSWSHTDMGTVVSIGETAVAHDITYMGIDFPINTFGGIVAETLKKGIAVKWINKITRPTRAVRAWPDM